MSKYDASELTNEGLRLSSLAANGKTSFTITRVASTADDLSGVDVTELTALPNEIQTGTINDRLISPDGNNAIVGTDVTFENSGLTESYSIGAVGLYATEAGEGKPEVLYAVVKAIKPEFIPDFADKVLMQFGMIVYVIVGKAENVEVTINPAGMATKEYVDKAIEAHKVILPATLMYSDKDAEIAALWKFLKDPTNANGSPYVARETADGAYVRDNKNGSVTYGDNVTIEPADKNRSQQLRENGTSEPANFDSGDLTIDKDLEVLGGKIFSESEDYEDFVKAHDKGIFLITEDDPAS